MSANSILSQPASSPAGGAHYRTEAPAAIDTSCRLPLVVLFLGAAVWLLVGSAFGLIASIKFHAPAFLAEPGWLTYGRVRPTSVNSLLYGFCVPAGLGVALWMLARLGRAALAAPWLVVVGALCCNLGVAVGLLGILSGGSTGFENLEMPAYAASLVLLGYLMMAVWGALTFHQRRERQVYVSQWFLLAALLWFPWIYSTASLVLQVFPLRGMAQAVIAWWYADNLARVWFGLVGLAVVFYLLPKLTGRELRSRQLALLTFWLLLLCGSWGGIPASAPLPAWLPALSALAKMLGIITLLSVVMNLTEVLKGFPPKASHHPSLWFICFGLVAFILVGLTEVVTAFSFVNRFTLFTWFTPAISTLNSYGFFTMVIFGAIYCVAPQLIGLEFPSPKLVRVHFWTTAAGVLLVVVPLAAGGIVQGLRLRQAEVPFTDIARGTLPFLRVSTIGDLLLALGHLLFLFNMGGLVCRFYRARALAAWAEATTEIKPAEARP